jgi:hypothetical protein
MEQPSSDVRSVIVISVGARICIMLALLLVVLAAYLFWSPLEKPTKEGIPFGCSTAANPPTEQFPRTVCGQTNKRRQLQAASVLIAAVIVGVGGVLTFGASRRLEQMRPQRAPGTSGGIEA